MVNIGKNCLWDEHGDHCHYVVNYGREGEKLEVSSMGSQAFYPTQH